MFYSFNETPFSYLIIGITSLVSYLALNNQNLLSKLMFNAVLVKENRQYYRMLTSGFVHNDYGHLFFNMLTLFFFGPPIERIMHFYIGLPNYTFPLFYLAAIAVSEIPSYIKHKANPNYWSLGASGATSAVTFALILIKPWMLIYIKFIPLPAIIYGVGYLAYSAYMGKKGGDNIGHTAHLFGALFGIVAFIAIYPPVVQIFMQQIQQPSFGR
jgi:membrane associated rhomboid family serine protease